MMNIYLSLFIVVVATLGLQKVFWYNPLFISSFIMVYYILYTFTTIAIFSLCMQLCWKKISITQFTMYMTISNLGLAAGAGSLGFLKNNLEWEFVIMVVAINAALVMVFLKFILLEKHEIQLAVLDSLDLK
jgi:MFS transporter, PAT family, beta-lactamase induction signal transducer AmpG